jgi:hypothetical protein
MKKYIKNKKAEMNHKKKCSKFKITDSTYIYMLLFIIKHCYSFEY